jgi:DNA helicase-2/ATP-dependent DNA helicase PcrA
MQPRAEVVIRRPRSLREHVAAVLADRERVSEAQEAVVHFSRNFFLHACPGSGKTRTVGLRLAWASVDGRGRAIAATSYTNAAVAEMERAAAEAGVPITQPHWVGTIHSFLITYVLSAFAPLALGATGPPRIIAEDYQRPPTKQVFYDRRKPPVSPWDFEYTATGDVVYKPSGYTRLSAAVQASLQSAIKDAKAALAKRGFVSQTDGLYYAMRLLEDHPELAAAVAARFDELIVDEVQDSSPIQLRCVELLCASGQLRSLVLCGDLNQAIYSFTGADPVACEAFVAARNLETLTLNENFRTAQAICDVVPCFSLQPYPDVARGPHRAFGVEPELLRFSPDECQAVIDGFRARLDVYGLPVGGATVLARRHEFKDQLNGTEAAHPPRQLDILGRACARYQRGSSLPAATVRAVDTLLATIAFESPAEALEEPAVAAGVRAATMRLLDNAPDVTRPLADWIAGMQAATKSALAPFEPLHKRVGDRIRRFKGCESYTAAEAFGGGSDDVLEADVIHRVKGQSHDAVLLVAEPATGARDNARLWIEATDTGEVTEEVRVAYVALTRARRYCAVALPDDSNPDIVDRFVAAGFRPVDDATQAASRKPYNPPALPSAGERVAALTNGQLAAALDRWSRRGADETAAWSRLVCEAAMPGTSARAQDWTVLSTATTSPYEPASDANPVWVLTDAAVNVDIELLDENDTVSQVAEAPSLELRLRVRVWLRPVADDAVDVVVQNVLKLDEAP